jgi:hypothetical protein
MGGREMNFMLRWLVWLCDYGTHTLFYLFAFLLAPIGFAASVTGNRKLVKIFIILAILTALVFFICFILYALGLA